MGGIIDAFELEPQLPRDAALDLDPEPLLFTPSQRQQGTPVTPSVRSEPSVERLRAAEAPQPPEPPQLSVERERADVAEPPDEEPLLFGTQPITAAEPASPREASPMPVTPTRERLPTDLEQPLMPLSEEPLPPPSPSGALPPARISVGSDRLQLAPEAEISPAAATPTRELAPQVEPAQPELMLPSPRVTPRIPPGSPVRPEEDEGERRAASVEGGPPTQEAPPTPKRGRKRKVYVMADEGATEISAAEFRAALNDTSDLLRQPTQRRRVGTARATRFEELISRPTVPLAPQLMELFTANFRADELILASPISDADLGERVPREEEEPEKEAEAEAEAEKEEEPQPEKEVTADPSLAQLAGLEAAVPIEEEEEIMPSAAAVPAPRDTISPVLPPPIAEMEEARALSMGRESVGVSVSAAPEEEGVFTLRQVAETVAQVESEESVTEATVSARTRKMQELMLSRLEDGEFDFTDALAEVGGRRTAARCFYELLNLSNKKAVALRQEEAYGRIWARPIQPTFNALLES
ncbi:LPXTG-motif cell wall anchor domain protein [Gracilaria domingensis]|nr:LPXTG-motif cell wall anchor domain protein [Gracilaria domingensis]